MAIIINNNNNTFTMSITITNEFNSLNSGAMAHSPPESILLHLI